MMDSVREGHKGESPCDGVNCDKCPLKSVCTDENVANEIELFAFDYIEAVEEWSREHPVVTMADKFKEVFGVEPKNKEGLWCCPRCIGFLKKDCDIVIFCNRCKEQFWNSEYKEPGKEKG